MIADLLKSWWTPTLAALLSGGVALKEWWYWLDHPHARGPSGYIVVLALAVTVACVHVAAHALEREQKERAHFRRLAEQARRDAPR